MNRPLHPALSFALAALALVVPALAQDASKPWRLNDHAGLPDWLKVGGAINVDVAVA